LSRPILAVDLGGTSMRVAVVDEDGDILDRDERPTPDDTDTLAAFTDFVGAFRARHEVERAVFAVPSRIDHEVGALLRAPNIPPKWAHLMTRESLERALGISLILVNDADVAAVGETYFGAARGHADVVYVTISTGVGAGIVVGGRIVLPRFSGGELGFTIIDRAALAGGKPATVEDLGSGTAIARIANERGIDGDARDVVRLMQAGDTTAAEIWADAMAAVGIGIANLVQLVSPTAIVLGGGVGANNGELVRAPIRDALERHGPPGPQPEVVTAALGDDPGLVGAAAWHRATQGLGVPTGGSASGGVE
jgi:glucokinase